MMLRCTAKVLALLRVAEPAIGEAGDQDWYAHLIWEWASADRLGPLLSVDRISYIRDIPGCLSSQM